jgi:hypothetical protein
MSLIEKMKELTELLDKKEKESVYLKQDSIMQVTDQSEIANKYLSLKAQTVLSNKSRYLTHKDETGFYKCIYLGVKVESNSIEDGVRAISESLNTLAEKDLIHSCLCHVSSVELNIYSLAAMSAVLAYVLVPEDREKEARELAKYVIDENGVCKTLSPI